MALLATIEKKSDAPPERLFTRWIVVIMILVLCALLASAAKLYHKLESRHLKEIENEIISVARLKVFQIDNWLDERRGNASSIMEDPPFSESVITWMENRSPQAESKIRARFNRTRKYYHYYDVWLIDVEGNTLLSVRDNGLSHKYDASKDVLDESFRDRTVRFTDIHSEADNSKPHLGLIAPLFHPVTNQPLVAVIFIIDVQQFLFPFLESWPAPSRTAETLIVQREGDHVLFLNNLRHASNASLNLRIPLTQTGVPAVKAVLGDEGFLSGRDYRGVEVVAASYAIPDTPWYLIAKIDRAEAFAAWRIQSFLLLVVFLGCVALIFSLGLFFRQRENKSYYLNLYRAESELRRNIERHETTLRAIGDAVIATDEKGRVSLLNPVAEALTGWKSEEAKDRPLNEVFQIVNEDTRATVESPVTKVFREGMVVGLANHTLLISKSGAEFPIADSGAPIKGDQGEITGVVLVFRDQTEERNAANKLRKADDLFRTFFDNAPIGKAIISLDGKYMRVNAAFAEMLGYTADELQAKSTSDITHPEDLEKTAEAIRILCEEITDQVEFEKRFLTKGGPFIWARVTNKIQWDEHGRPLYFITHIQDITEHRKAEERLHYNELLLEEMGRVAKIGGWEFDPATGQGTWTKEVARIHDLDPNQETNVQLGLSVYSGESRRKIERAIKEALESGKPYNLELEMTTPAGTRKWVQTIGTPMMKNGKVVKMRGSFQDITERINAEEILHQREEILRLFIEHAPTALAMFDRNMCYLAASRRWKADYSLGDRDIIGQSHYEIFPEIHEEVKAFHQRGMAGEVIENNEDIFERADGRSQWLRWEMRPWYDSNHDVGGIVIFSEDISARKKAEEDIRTSKAFLDLVIDRSPFAMWISDDKGVIRRVNRSLCELLGLSEDAVVGKYNVLEDENLKKQGVMPDVKAVFENRHNARFSIRWEAADVGKSEFSKAKNLFIDVSMFPITNARGVLTNVVCQWVDITDLKRAEQALHEREEILRLFIEHAPTALAMFDRNMRYLAVSNRWKADYNLNGDIIGKPHYEVFPEIGDVWKQVHQRGLAGEVVIAEEDRFVRYDGTVQWLRWEVRPWYGPDGRVGGIVIFSEDITKRKYAEEALRESEARYRLVSENGADVIWLYDIAEQHFTFVSPSVEKLRGFTVEETLRHSLQDVVAPDSYQSVAENLAESIQAFMSGNESVRTQILEVYQACKDGSTVPTEVVATLIADDRGCITHIQGVTRDITERKRAEDAIRESETRFRTLVDNAPDGIFVQSKGEVLYANASMARLLGVKNPDKLNGADFMTWIAPEYRSFVRDRIRRQEETGLPSSPMEQEYVRLDGSRIPVETVAVSYRFSGRPGHLVFVRDITERRLAEESLKEQEEQYRLIADHSDDWIFWIGTDGNWRYVSPSCERLTGYPAEEFLTDPGFLLSIAHPDDRESIRDHDRNKYVDCNNVNMEYRIITKNGDVLWVNHSCSPIFDDEGKYIGRRGTNRNITERKKAEEALRESERQLRLITDNVQDTIWLMDLNFKTTWISPSVSKARGYTLEELSDMPLEEHLTTDSLKKALDLISDHMKPEILSDPTGEIVAYDEFEFRRKDGNTFWADTAFILIRDKNGNPSGFLGVGRDITERKKAEEALRDSEMRYRKLFEGSRDSVMIIEPPSWNFASCNPAAVRMFGAKSESELLSLGPWQLSPEFQPDGFSSYGSAMKMIEQTLDKGSHYFEWMHRRVNGEEFPASVLLSRIDLDQKTIILASARDTSAKKRESEERKKLEDQLNQAQKLESIGRLAGGVAHDFNNLLTIINNYSELSLLDLRPDDPLHQTLEYILEAGERAAVLTRQLLAFSRRQMLQPVLLDINDIIGGMEKMLRRLIGEDIVVNTNYEPDLGKVMADPGQIEQVLMNLVVNARDAMPNGGFLTIETSNVELDEQYAAKYALVLPGHYVMLAVTDTGFGMDEQTKANIFEPFFTTKEKGKGTGLGLAMVYGIVKQSGGHIVVYSEPDHGTTFKVYLPLTESSEETSTVYRKPSKIHTGNETILLVEDEKEVRALMEQILKASGYNLLVCSSPAEALLAEEQYSEKIDLLLTDVVMPQMNGRQLAERLHKRRPDMKVIYMSGYTDDAIVHRGILEQDTHFISKPFTIAALTEKIRKVLNV